MSDPAPKKDDAKKEDHGHGDHGHGGGSKVGMAWALGILLIVLMYTGVLWDFIRMIVFFANAILGIISAHLGMFLAAGALAVWFGKK